MSLAGLVLVFLPRQSCTVGNIAGLCFVKCVILFLSRDPELCGKDVLPTAGDGDHRAFHRNLPKFPFSQHACSAICIARIASLFPFLDQPVSHSLLLVYFMLVAMVRSK
jgi:hypothetical protein